MIRKYYFAPFNYLIKTLLANESLLALDPILAGGFPVALFNELKQINSAHGWQQLFNRVNKHGFQAIKTEFSDIDIYFLENNPIWHSKYQWLVANSRNTPSKYIQNNPFGFQLPIPTYHSKWVNSYLSNNHSDTTHYQIVKFPHASIEKCLNNFDLKICCIAWYNDYIYVHQSFEESFNQSRIEVNEPGFYKRSQEDIYARIFTAQRAYKYANRLNFKLSSDLDQFCAALYTETQSINLESDAPLLNAAGQVSRNPVPSSAAFQSVINYFLSQHEHYVGMRSSLKQNQKSSNDRQTTFKPKKKLTIGMVTYDDYDGVYFSVQA
ncbi:MAG TPA: hypothetical protein ENI62_10430, partial [Gammaproteobacteria bacterium]|nr:hypothetical protein [Gammaproteobacteria bacterium]